MICGVEFNWQLEMKSTPQGSITEPVLFNVFINNVEDELQCLSASSQVIENGEKLIYSPEGWTAVPRDLIGEKNRLMGTS